MPENLPILNVDFKLIKRVIYNLFINIINHCGKNPKIYIKAEANTGNQIKVSVCDNGPGIDDHHKNKIFNDFYEINNSDFSSGLGLSFCKIAIEAHNGKIWVENNNKGGSKFVFILPFDGTAKTL